MTFAVRMRIPTGQGGNAGQVSIDIDYNSIISRPCADARDGFFWTAVTTRVPKNVSNLNVTIWGNTDAVASDITIDRAVLVTGQIPRDLNTLLV
ncbi:hypothetical protein [Pseudarthrobacter sp. B907]|uniref:hypothetical protein n=1 Tax=Pseudarthrobacter sp. B907 TaxID=3158261 RepID=UPI0032DBA017